MLKNNQYDPQNDVKKNENMILEWNSGKNKMKKEVKEYFHNRREDSLSFLYLENLIYKFSFILLKLKNYKIEKYKTIGYIGKLIN